MKLAISPWWDMMEELLKIVHSIKVRTQPKQSVLHYSLSDCLCIYIQNIDAEDAGFCINSFMSKICNLNIYSSSLKIW